MHIAHQVSDGTRPAGILDVFLTFRDFKDIGREFAVGAPQIDLENQAIQISAFVHDVEQGRVGDAATVPVVLAINFCRGETRWQRAGCHDVFRPDFHVTVVKEDEVTRTNIGCSQRDAHRVFVVDAIKIHQAFQGAPQG